ncbi:PREDICTED: patatin-like phospholipase domain-containing protein 2 isoform X2 [Nicrophorus vespilloides]|uniref:Patatin-like phospholipase domain-containing protein 2 isoform X2 n=1 Tax=Nicrophorus vespilloides TaxID=110193 RepID=A0ABM1MMU4_NICVS|nr:PREDICTED: patatin-like phospholipase domain-containing protein 2 isoform X2 [Nicrophorus vespilloides]
MNLSFAGCGFLGIYHAGVAVCFRKYAPHLLLNKISGASAGAIAACCLLCDLPLGDLTSDVLRVATEARSKSLGPFAPSFNIQDILFEGISKVLPDDAHLMVNGKLHISLTRVYDGKNVIVSHFDSKEDLMQALLCSAFIPLFSGLLPPKFHGVRYMDGGFSDNLPTLDENTITVSPFCGESDICPRDDSMQLFHINVANTSIELSKHNIYRIARILFPPKPEILSNMCKQGFDDALRFLHRNNLINCTRCLAVQSTFVVSESLDESFEYDPQCNECKIHRQEALVSNLPDTVLTIFQDAIDTANKGLVNWVFKHRGMKLLSVLSLPYTVPADMVYATFTKLMSSAPFLGNNLWDMSKFFMDQFSSVLNKVNSKRQQLSAKISCQLAITEYGGKLFSDNFDVEACQGTNKMNLNFTFNLDDEDLPLSKSSGRRFTTNKVLSRKPSMTVNKTDAPVDDDTFDHILHVTAQHEAIMAYYYLDENNKVKVTEIFDVSESENPAFQTNLEKELNRQLEFDDDWDESTWSADQPEFLRIEDRSRSMAELSEYSIEDILDKDTSNLFSDPESEWVGTYKIDEPDDFFSDARPESDQPDLSKPYVIPSMSFDTEYM